MALIFTSLARDAGDTVSNVFAGAVLDSFAPFIVSFHADNDAVDSYMQRIMEVNPSIVHLAFAQLDITSGQWVLLQSSDATMEGLPAGEYAFVLSQASIDSRHSVTVADRARGERLFRTARIVQLTGGKIFGAVLITQTLSEADRKISSNINKSIWLLSAILVFLLFLFFRHARTLDYATLYRRLKELDALKDDFIGMASHELRTPLTAIRGYASLVIEKVAPNSEHFEMLRRIDTSAKDLDQLIADILDVSKISSGGITYNLETMSPTSIIDDVMGSLSEHAAKKGLTLTANTHSDVQLLIDAVRFKQVLINIIGNAIKYTEHGSITVKGSVDARVYTLRISDTGMGMSAEDQKLLFTKFYRVNCAEVRAQTGTGLGLWITKQLVEHMKGTISIESIKGVGTHVVLSFPLVATVK
jgi:signal transduction histidine kinase